MGRIQCVWRFVEGLHRTPSGLTACCRSDDKRTSLSQTLRDLIAQDGILGLWKGIVPALVLVSNPTVQYMVYEQLSVWWIARTTKSVPGKRIKHRRVRYLYGRAQVVSE